MTNIKHLCNEATLTVDTAALRHNLYQVRKQAPQAKVWAVLKSNAYGHGLVAVAQALTDANGFALARFSEAKQLRDHNITKQILLLEGVFDSAELLYCTQHNIALVVHCQQQLDLIQATTLPTPVQVWLKIDTGMGRLGFRPELAGPAAHQLGQIAHVQKPLHFMTHFSHADATQNPFTQQQIATFHSILPKDKGCISLANSAGIFSWPQSHGDWVRPGLCLYGVSPFTKYSAASLNLKPAMRVQAPLIAIRQIKAGEYVGYERAWQAPQDCTVGVVAIGYGDGYPRNAPAGTPVFLNGRTVPIIGKVSMDMLTVNLGDNAQDNIGDMATLWGKELPIAQVAQTLGTIPYELLTQVGSRYHRYTIDSANDLRAAK